HRSTREDQYFVVNGRWVQSGSLSQALRHGYRSLLPSDRHPVALVMMELPGGEVDVNFHPAKREVRFAREGWVWNELRRAVAASVAVVGQRGAMGLAGGPGWSVAEGPARLAAGGGPGAGGVAEWPELYRTAESLPPEIRERFVAPATGEEEEPV